MPREEVHVAALGLADLVEDGLDHAHLTERREGLGRKECRASMTAIVIEASGVGIPA